MVRFDIGRWRDMAKTSLVLGGLLAVTFVTGCQNADYEEKKALREQNRELQAALDERRAMEAQNAPLTPPEPAKTPEPAPTPTPTPAPKPTPTVAIPPAAAPTDLGGEASLNTATGEMTVNFLGDTLFSSGQATLKAEAKTSLDKMVAGLKKQYAGMPVKVQGHSDSDPIRVSKWKSNQELSEARAKAVKDYLVQKGVEASRITSEGFGEVKPKSRTDKSQNRRVEIVVMTK